jgi:nucleosome assembly protein 1-like 1
LATPEEIAAGEAESLKDDETYIPLSKDLPPSSTGIPEFWLTALRNHMGLSELITERDSAALKHLIDVRIEHIKDADAKQEDADAKQGKLGYKIIFEFSPNDFFENKTLEKSYIYGQEVDYTGELVYDNAVGTTIQWKEDKDLTKEFEIKKQRNKSVFSTFLRNLLLIFFSPFRYQPHSAYS